MLHHEWLTNMLNESTKSLDSLIPKNAFNSPNKYMIFLSSRNKTSEFNFKTSLMCASLSSLGFQLLMFTRSSQHCIRVCPEKTGPSPLHRQCPTLLCYLLWIRPPRGWGQLLCSFLTTFSLLSLNSKRHYQHFTWKFFSYFSFFHLFDCLPLSPCLSPPPSPLSIFFFLSPPHPPHFFFLSPDTGSCYVL